MIWHGILNDANYPQIVKPIDFNMIRVHFENSFPSNHALETSCFTVVRG